jgi:hypothetical protein
MCCLLSIIKILGLTQSKIKAIMDFDCFKEILFRTSIEASIQSGGG